MPTELEITRVREAVYEAAVDALEVGMSPGEFMVQAVEGLRAAAEQEKEHVLYYLDKIRGQL
jgi:hypothetical protein